MGPLAGVKIVELAGIGPGPFCAMLLADMGADIVRVDRTTKADLGVARAPKHDLLNRGRRSVAVDLKTKEGVETVLRLVEQADALIEGYRPGVTERLGLGPDDCMARNSRLVYGRMTGWGQDGPLAPAAGHDINYISLTGALHAIGSPGAPVPPLNLVGDFGGGALYLALGVVAALLEAKGSGQGQVVDAAMTDGAASLMMGFYGMMAQGTWADRRGVNILDGGAHFYNVYECADGKFISVGSIEKRFYELLLRDTGLAGEDLPAQMDPSGWADLRDRLAGIFKTKTRQEWCDLMEGSDICFAPVLSLEEAPTHPHNAARGTFIEIDGVTQPAPAPRFSRTGSEVRCGPPAPGENTKDVLADWGFSDAEIAELQSAGAVV